jgi:hypothetical protein
MMQGRDGDAAAVAAAGESQAGGRDGACSGCGWSEGWREGMVVLLCSLSLGRKTYTHEVQGHYGPVAWAGPPLSFQHFSFLLLLSFSMLLCCYSLQWYGIASASNYHT